MQDGGDALNSIANNGRRASFLHFEVYTGWMRCLRHSSLTVALLISSSDGWMIIPQSRFDDVRVRKIEFISITLMSMFLSNTVPRSYSQLVFSKRLVHAAAAMTVDALTPQRP